MMMLMIKLMIIIIRQWKARCRLFLLWPTRPANNIPNIYLTSCHWLFHRLRRKYKSVIWPATIWPEKLWRLSAVHLAYWKCRNRASSCIYVNTRTLPVRSPVSEIKQCLHREIRFKFCASFRLTPSSCFAKSIAYKVKYQGQGIHIYIFFLYYVCIVQMCWMLNGRANEWADGRSDDLDNKWLLARLERCEGETTARVDEGKDGWLLRACSVVGSTHVWWK